MLVGTPQGVSCLTTLTLRHFRVEREFIAECFAPERLSYLTIARFSCADVLGSNDFFTSFFGYRWPRLVNLEPGYCIITMTQFDQIPHACPGFRSLNANCEFYELQVDGARYGAENENRFVQVFGNVLSQLEYLEQLITAEPTGCVGRTLFGGDTMPQCLKSRIVSSEISSFSTNNIQNRRSVAEGLTRMSSPRSLSITGLGKICKREWWEVLGSQELGNVSLCPRAFPSDDDSAMANEPRNDASFNSTEDSRTEQ